MTTSYTSYSVKLDNIYQAINNGVNQTQYNENISSEVTPLFAHHFLYNVINDQIYQTYISGGTVTSSDSLANLAIDTTVGSYAVLRTRDVVKYQPGTNVSLRCSAIFNTPVALSTQRIGVGSAINEFSFGYNGLDFGVLRAYGGKIQVMNLAITTASSGISNCTVTLNSVAYVVPLTNAAGSIPFTCYELTKGNYNNLWIVSQNGNNVRFTSNSGVGARSGTYSFTHASAAGTFSTGIVGQTQTTEWVSETNFNRNNTLSASINKQLGNIYVINYTWLGFGNVSFSMLDPTTNSIELLHVIEYAGTSATPSIAMPHMPVQLSLGSLGSSTAMSLKSASMGVYQYGSIVQLNEPKFSVFNERAATSAGVNTVLLCIRNRYTYNNVINASPININSIFLSCDGTKVAVFKIILNPTISAGTTADFPNFSFVDETNGLALLDTTALTYSGGSVLYTFALGKSSTSLINFPYNEFQLNRNDILVVSCLSANATNASCSISFTDDL